MKSCRGDASPGSSGFTGNFYKFLQIRQEPKIKGFKLGNYQHKIDIYADDLTAYLDGS